MSIHLAFLDYSVIAAYFLLVFGIAYFVTKKEKKSSDDYFLAGKDLGWFVIGASLFASNIGSEHLIGLAGEGAKSGVAVAQFEILASFMLFFLGWVFVPFYMKSGVTTMPEFLEKRYGRAARNYLSFISVVGYVITKISATIFAGAVVFEAIGLDFWLGAFVVVISTGIYTIAGGLKAVIYTDTLQMFIMIFGSILLVVLGLNAAGGWEAVTTTLKPGFLSMWKPGSDTAFPWTGIIFGAPILGIWYWCTDQFIVQRVLAAKNIDNARQGTLFAGLLKQLPLFIFVIPGIICFALAQQGVLTLAKTDHALPALIATILPTGLKGLVFAGLLAALMSSLSSVFNSCSTLITYDFYKLRKPNASDKELLLFGKVATLILVILGMLWIPLMKHVSGSLFTYIQSVQAYIAPPIACLFLLGLFMKRLNHTGAMLALSSGFVLGVGRLIAEINKESLSGFMHTFATINFLHFAAYFFVFSSLVLILGSLLAPAPDAEKIKGLVFEKGKREFTPTKKRDALISVLITLIIVIIWIVFS